MHICGTLGRWVKNSALPNTTPHQAELSSENKEITCKFLCYPILGCDIQGFRAMGLSVQYWPRWFQDFPAIWLAVPFGANGANLGICTLPEKNYCVWNKLFLGEIKFSQRGTHPGKSLWWQIVPMQESTNEWKNLTIFQIVGLVVHNGKTSNSEVPIDKINIEIL